MSMRTKHLLLRLSFLLLFAGKVSASIQLVPDDVLKIIISHTNLSDNSALLLTCTRFSKPKFKELLPKPKGTYEYVETLHKAGRWDRKQLEGFIKRYPMAEGFLLGLA